MLDDCHLWRTDSTSCVHTRGRISLHVWCMSRKFPESRAAPDSHESELEMWRLFTWWWIKTSQKNSPNLWILLVTPPTTWRGQKLWLSSKKKVQVSSKTADLFKDLSSKHNRTSRNSSSSPWPFALGWFFFQNSSSCCSSSGSQEQKIKKRRTCVKEQLKDTFRQTCISKSLLCRSDRGNTKLKHRGDVQKHAADIGSPCNPL